MAYLPTPSIEVLEHYLTYDQEKGTLKPSPWIEQNAPMLRMFSEVERGKLKGQEMINLFGVKYAAKRIAFKMSRGREARKPIGFKNDNLKDYTPENLFEASGAPSQMRTEYKDHEKALLYHGKDETFRQNNIEKYGIKSALSGLYQFQTGLEALMRMDVPEGKDYFRSDLAGLVEKAELMKGTVNILVKSLK